MHKRVILIYVFIILLTCLNADESIKLNVDFEKNIKEKKIYPMGKKIFEKKCEQNIDLTNFSSMKELKSEIQDKHLCKVIKEKHLEALSLYLWDVKRVVETQKEDINKIIVTKKEKCPVCGMFVYKYEKWASQIFYKYNSREHHYSFDGVKDMMKFYFAPNEECKDCQIKSKDEITKILVIDYYTQKTIDASKAFYVIGSDVYGPMGDELIPFKNEKDAKTFYMDHSGSKIIKFEDIKAQEVYKLDE